MLYLFDKQTNALRPCIETSFCDHALLERQNIEKWVELFPEILGEDLLILTTEYDRFDKTAERLDLLALDKQGSLVVVELKRDDSGKNVDLQAIKYAAYCSTLCLQDIVDIYHDAQQRKGRPVSVEEARGAILQFIENDEFEEFNQKPRIILVASEFRTEVTASVLWLRKCGLDITCVKLSPYTMPDNHIAFDSSILIPLPEAKDFVIQSERKDAKQTVHTVTQTETINFFKDVITLLKQRMPRDYAPPDARSYYKIPTGIAGVHFEWGFHGRPRVMLQSELEMGLR